ncbi:MAG: flagellar biosynthetic protein FliO [Proteobacteria bacterium]|nr:flagellar biosynthetic protein FliO [Pseudomonadota bacterium]MBU1737652.1 flagellar biosynthetic protein FliO [Pseudomonadota bacterium]
MTGINRILSTAVPAGIFTALFLTEAFALTTEPGIPAAVSPGSTASLLLAIVKVAGALALVIGLMMLTMMLFRKFGVGRSDLGSGSLISILDTRMVAPKKYVAVLKIADELIAVGITDQQINLLGHLENGAEIISSISEKNVPAGGFSFPDILDRAAGSLKNLKNRHQ